VRRVVALLILAPQRGVYLEVDVVGPARIPSGIELATSAISKHMTQWPCAVEFVAVESAHSVKRHCTLAVSLLHATEEGRVLTVSR
jgi:hypothetical protein